MAETATPAEVTPAAQPAPEAAPISAAPNTAAPAGTEAVNTAPAEPATVAPGPAAAPAEAPDPFKLLGLEDNEATRTLIAAAKEGKLKDYLQHSTTDYRAMSDEQVFRMQLEADKPGAPKELIDALLKKKMAEYDLGEFDDESNALSESNRKYEADKVRDALEAKQQAYRFTPATTEPSLTPEQQQAQAAQAKEQQALQSSVESHPALSAFEATPVIRVGEGGDAYSFDASASKASVRDALSDVRSFYAKFWSRDAAEKPVFDMAKFIKVLAYADNMNAIEAGLVAHGKTLGSKAEYNERHNPDTEMTGAAPASEKAIKAWIA